MGVLLLVNFLMCIYIMCRYKKEQEATNEQNENQFFTDKDVCSRTCHMILYDIGICCYIIIVIFGVVVSCLGYEWVGASGSSSDCPDSLKYLTYASCLLYQIYIVLGLLLFLITILTMAADEGCGDCFKTCCCCCCFCLGGCSDKSTDKVQKRLRLRQ